MMVSIQSASWSQRQTQFKGHVESWAPGRHRIELHTRKIVNGVLAFGNELQEAVKTICGRLNFEDTARFQSKRRRAGDEGHVQFLVSLIKRNVEKDVSGWRRFPRHF